MRFGWRLTTLVALAMAAPATGAPIQIEQSTVIFDAQTGIVTFHVIFDRAPDFFTIDEFDRQQDAFQYNIFYDNVHKIRVHDSDVFVRGSEFQYEDAIRFRDLEPAGTGGPGSGGWGPLRGSVPYVLNGASLEFSAPLSLGKLCTCGDRRAAVRAQGELDAVGVARFWRSREPAGPPIGHRTHLACGGMRRWRTA